MAIYTQFSAWGLPCPITGHPNSGRFADGSGGGDQAAAAAAAAGSSSSAAAAAAAGTRAAA